MRTHTTFGLSLRLPPSLDKDFAYKTMKDFFENKVKVINGAKIEVSGEHIG